MFDKKRLLACWICMVLLPVGIWGCRDSSITIKGYPNGHFLAEARDLEESGVVIIDARSAAAHDAGHIPGAISLPWRQFSDAGVNLLPVSELENLLGAAGLRSDTPMIIYDDTTASNGAAGRLFWMFEYLGCTRVRILDGGWDKWIADGNTVEASNRSLPAAVFAAKVNPSVVREKTAIAARLNDADMVLVDVRTDEEFMGWTLKGEARGGHIPGAVQTSYQWYFQKDKTVLPYDQMRKLFESRGVTRDKEVVAYCTIGIRSAFAYFLFRLMGYDRVANYDASIKDWAVADEMTYPMKKLPNYAKVIYPQWVNQMIEYHKHGSTADAPPEYPYGRDHKYLIFETQWGSIEEYADDYKAGHIPGAIHSDSDIYENGYPRWFLINDDALHTVMGSMGITADTTVIVYSDSPIFAARLWWILTYGGVHDVRYLNGGYEQWIAAGYAGQKKTNLPVPAVFDGFVNPDIMATTDHVSDVYMNTAMVFLADVRSRREHIGEISGYGYAAMKGRIPNSVWADDADDGSLVYCDPDGTLRSFTEVRNLWADIGMTASRFEDRFDKDVIFYCGAGYRSALTFLYAHLMGYENIRNYSDGWLGWSTTYTQDPACTDSITPGWCQDPSIRPILTGAP